MNRRSLSATERLGQAILDLRRNPHARAIQRHIYSVGDHELTPVQVDILETVVANPGQRMNELARALGVDASTVSRTILPLLRLDLIERRTGASDRRHSCLLPTQAGLRQAAVIADAKTKLMRAVQGRLPPDRLELLADLLEDYMEAITAESLAMMEMRDPD